MRITQTLKNIGRLRKIITVFAKHGFYEVISQLGLSKYLGPFEEKIAKEEGIRLTPPQRVRLAFEELGGTFVKLGQIMSTRPDLIPKEYIEEFAKLQDSVAPMPFETVLESIESELGISVSDAFESIEEEPLGSASIAQVHKAILKEDGKVVVIKVQRPKVEKIIETDISILFTIADLMEKHLKDLSFFRPSDIVAEFARAIQEELDFTREAQNCDRLRRHFGEDEYVYIPEIIWELSSRRVMVMDFVEGIKISNVEELKRQGFDTKDLAMKGADAFFRMIFEYGMFHGDLHGGNVIVMKDARLGLIDFGLVGELSQQVIEDLADIFVMLFSQDFRGVAKKYIKLSHMGQHVDINAFAADLERLIKPWLDRPLREINVGRIFMDASQVALRHRISVPRDLVLLAKTLVSLEGIGRTLDPDFDLTEVSQQYAKRLLVEKYSPDRVMQEVLRLSRDVADLSKELPEQIGRLLDKVENEKIQVEMNLPQEEKRLIAQRIGARFGYSMLSAGSIIAGAIITGASGGNPGIWGAACFAISGISWLAFMWTFRP